MQVAEGEFVRDDWLDGGEQARGIGVFNYSGRRLRLARRKEKKKEMCSVDFLFGGGGKYR